MSKGGAKSRTVNGTTTVFVSDAANREVMECELLWPDVQIRWNDATVVVNPQGNVVTGWATSGAGIKR